MTKVHTRSSKVLAGVTGDIRHPTCSEEELDTLEKRVKQFKNMLVEAVDELCDSGLYTLRDRLLDHMVE